jgi:inorganic phosphate transporter, PiT family
VSGQALALLALAGLYAVVNGINDGGSLAGAAMQGSRLRPVTVVAVLLAAVVVVPLALGAPVAHTLAARLVDFDGVYGPRILAVAVVSAVAVTGTLAWLRLPTSLTLATVGAFVGAGLGGPSTVDGAEVGRVLLLGVAAPLLGAATAYVLMGVARLSVLARVGRAGPRVRMVTSTLVSLAYAANDGQKMIAVGVVASGASAASAAQPGVLLVVGLAAAFGAGTLVGMRRSGPTLGRGVVSARQSHLASSEVAAAGAVGLTGWLGAPVSMTQSLAGSLAGSGVNEGLRRVRWRLASRLVLAWVVTFPAALLIAGLVAALTTSAAEVVATSPAAWKVAP